MKLRVRTDGTVSCLYTEELDVAGLGVAMVTRASHVEPDGEGRWWADLAPSGGPRLGPFQRRSEALAAEAAWLEANL